jgi:hypothetical protein
VYDRTRFGFVAREFVAEEQRGEQRSKFVSAMSVDRSCPTCPGRPPRPGHERKRFESSFE